MTPRQQLTPRDEPGDEGRIEVAGRPISAPGGSAANEGRVVHLDLAIVRVAGRQKNLITWAQLVELGLSPGGIKHRVRTGRLHRVRRGVFSLSPLLMPLARELAAVLACGDGAMASHRSAAAVWGLLQSTGAVHVTVPERRRRDLEGVVVHRPREPRQRVIRQGVPVTTITQTILDLAATEPTHELERALNEARARGLASDHTLTSLTEQSANKPGAANLRAALRGQERGFTRSKAERLLRRVIEEAGLPRPLYNHRTADRERDAVFQKQRLVVEIDGYATHGTRRAFEQDRDRDQELTAQGWRVMRITWRQLTQEPTRTAARLARALYAAP